VYVLKESTTGAKGITRRWRGPYYVVKRVGLQLYLLKDAKGAALKNPVNIQKMKKYTERVAELADEQQGAVDDEATDGIELPKDYYEMEAILEAKGRGKDRRYLVRWKGYDDSQNTWEPREHFGDPRKVDEFEKQLRQQQKKS